MVTNNRQHPSTVPFEQVPGKIFYSISEASEYTGVEPHVLRYWETKFSKLNPKRVSGNQRKYTRNDLELLYEIVRLLYHEGYTLDGAERKLRMGLQALKAERKAEQEALAAVAQLSVVEAQPAEAAAEPAGDDEKYRKALDEIKQELLDILKQLP